MAYAPAMNAEFIVSYFGTLSRETSIDVMKEMLGKNMRQNLQMVVQVRGVYLLLSYFITSRTAAQGQVRAEYR